MENKEGAYYASLKRGLGYAVHEKKGYFVEKQKIAFGNQYTMFRGAKWHSQVF
jgi:hypothetical protein